MERARHFHGDVRVLVRRERLDFLDSQHRTRRADGLLRLIAHVQQPRVFGFGRSGHKIPGEDQLVLGHAFAGQNRKDVIEFRLPVADGRARRAARLQQRERRRGRKRLARRVFQPAHANDVARRLVQDHRRPQDEHLLGRVLFGQVQLDKIRDMPRHLAAHDFQQHDVRRFVDGAGHRVLSRQAGHVDVGPLHQQRRAHAIAIQGGVRRRSHAQCPGILGQCVRAELQAQAGLGRRIRHQVLVGRPRQRAVHRVDRIAVVVGPIKRRRQRRAGVAGIAAARCVIGRSGRGRATSGCEQRRQAEQEKDAGVLHGQPERRKGPAKRPQGN